MAGVLLFLLWDDACVSEPQIATMLTHILVERFHTTPVIGPYLNVSIFLLELIVAVLFHEWIVIRLANEKLDVDEWVEICRNENEANRARNEELAKAAKNEPPVAGNATPAPRRRGSVGVGDAGLSHLSSPSHPGLLKRRSSMLTRLACAVFKDKMSEELDDGSGLLKNETAHFKNFGQIQLHQMFENKKAAKKLRASIHVETVRSSSPIDVFVCIVDEPR